MTRKKCVLNIERRNTFNAFLIYNLCISHTYDSSAAFSSANVQWQYQHRSYR